MGGAHGLRAVEASHEPDSTTDYTDHTDKIASRSAKSAKSVVKKSVQGFNVRSLSGNSLPKAAKGEGRREGEGGLQKRKNLATGNGGQPLILRLALITWVFCGLSARGVIFYSTADPLYNSTAPTGDLADSGWDLQGSWSAFLGTPISPQHFITAKHLGGSPGLKFAIEGVEYTTTAVFDDPGSDLRIWKVRGRFASFAQLYPRTDEVGKDMVVFGRGTQRGAEVTVTGLPGSTLGGWLWGAADGRKRWGQNRVAGVVTRSGGPATGAGTAIGESGELLRISFDADGGPNEAHLSAGDSGGGLFIQDGGIWKLAGINFLVDGLYNTSDTGPGFQAAIFDEGGLYKGQDGNWTRIPDSTVNLPGAFYATRISIRLNWIDTILSQTASDDGPILESAPAVMGPFEDEINADVDTATGVVTLPAPASVRFYRLNSATELRIIGLSLRNGNLVFQYQ